MLARTGGSLSDFICPPAWLAAWLPREARRIMISQSGTSGSSSAATKLSVNASLLRQKEEEGRGREEGPSVWGGSRGNASFMYLPPLSLSLSLLSKLCVARSLSLSLLSCETAVHHFPFSHLRLLLQRTDGRTNGLERSINLWDTSHSVSHSLPSHLTLLHPLDAAAQSGRRAAKYALLEHRIHRRGGARRECRCRYLQAFFVHRRP